MQIVLEDLFGNEERYHQWFLEVLGIQGNPVETRRQIGLAKASGASLGPNPYGYKRAFTTSPSLENIHLIRRLAALRVGTDKGVRPEVLDPFSGGGSIPFEAVRYGCRAIATELNPVAIAILQGTIAAPFSQGVHFRSILVHWGNLWCNRIEERLREFFCHVDQETIRGFIWAHTVPCPTTGNRTPLLHQYWLARTAGQKVALELSPNPETGDIKVGILPAASKTEGDRRTYNRGVGTSLFTRETFDGKYISQVAQKGNLGNMLLAVAYRPAQGKGTQFRIPNAEDLSAWERANNHVKANWDVWDARGLIPTEAIPEGNKTKDLLRYGMRCWYDMFTPRQLLTLVTAIEELHGVVKEAEEILEAEELRALNLYLAFAIDKVVDYNSRFVIWDPTRLKIAHAFTQHAFPFKSAFSEMDGVEACRWGLAQVVDCYRDLAKLAVGNRESQLLSQSEAPLLLGEPTLASATALPIAEASIDAIVTDPPYHDNIMYAELSDYFYVWLKRSLMSQWPELCQQYLSDKDNEAVANVSRFNDMATHKGRGKKNPGTFTAQELAAIHYESLMSSAFRESYRVLRTEGSLTVMFNHKKTGAWNSLAFSLLEAGFQVASSWPVTTESPHSLHQRDMNAANTTILLTCLKRQSTESAFWHDIKEPVRIKAREAAIAHAQAGLQGVDITLASFGAVLGVLSAKWPVYTGELDADGRQQLVSPEKVLDLARQEVSNTKLEHLYGQAGAGNFDPPTNWWLLAWMDFGTSRFPAGEALKLSHATHLDLDTVLQHGYRLIQTKAGKAEILTPERRFEIRAFKLGLDAQYETWIDRLHALMVTYSQDGLPAAREWLRRTGLVDNVQLQSLIHAAIRAVPRNRDRNDVIIQSEARTLEGIRATLFPEIEVPHEDIPYAQDNLL